MTVDLVVDFSNTHPDARVEVYTNNVISMSYQDALLGSQSGCNQRTYLCASAVHVSGCDQVQVTVLAGMDSGGLAMPQRVAVYWRVRPESDTFMLLLMVSSVRSAARG